MQIYITHITSITLSCSSVTSSLTNESNIKTYYCNINITHHIKIFIYILTLLNTAHKTGSSVSVLQFGSLPNANIGKT
jgi:hypothetical protein